jgi:hypothetical protein
MSELLEEKLFNIIDGYIFIKTTKYGTSADLYERNEKV